MDVEGNGHSGRIAHSLARDFNNARAHNFVLLRGDSQSCCLCYSTSVVHFHFQGGWIPCIFRGSRAKTARRVSYVLSVTISRFFNNPSIIDLERLKISSTRHPTSQVVVERFYDSSADVYALLIYVSLRATTGVYVPAISVQGRWRCRTILQSWFCIMDLHEGALMIGCFFAPRKLSDKIISVIERRV